MKKKHYLTVLTIIISVLLLFGGCSANLEKLEDKDSRQITEAMLDALIENNPKAAYSLVSHICNEEDFKPTFTQMQEILGNADTYELKLLYLQTNASIAKGEKNNSVSSVYEMNCTAGKFIVNIKIDKQVGLHSFYLTPYEKTDYYFTGTLKTIENANGTQWILLLSNILSIGLMVFALVDCCRQKLNRKIFWILLLTLGFITIGATISSTGFRLNFTYGWITAYSALIHYGSGTSALRLMIPVSAIVYLAMRRSLLDKHKANTYSAEQESQSLADETPLTPNPTDDQE